MEIEIIFEYDNPTDNWDYFTKGYRDDVIVKVGDRKYKLYAVTMDRIRQNFEVDFRIYHFYMAEVNTVLVKEATKEEIENTIRRLYQWRYFEALDQSFC